MTPGGQRPPDLPDTTGEDDPVLELSPHQCWTKLRDARVGRVGVATQATLNILPVNYVSEGRSIVFATSSAVIIAAATNRAVVAFEADGYDRWTAWSVLAHGVLEPLHADPVPDRLRSMMPGPKALHYRLRPATITGRLFDRATEEPFPEPRPKVPGAPERRPGAWKP